MRTSRIPVEEVQAGTIDSVLYLQTLSKKEEM
jgi:hypothetical protein